MKGKILLILSVILIFLISCTQKGVDKKYGAKDLTCWQDGYFVQENIDMSQYDNKIIRAKVDGKWQEYKTVDVPDAFIKWNWDARLGTMERFRNHQPPKWAGPHNGIVATYGAMRKDTQFKLNNAVKGMGFLPKKEKIKDIIKMLKETNDNSFPAKLDTLTSIYEHGKEIFDLNKQLSLELYTNPNFITQTFLNQILNPVSTIVFLDIPSYKLKTVVQLFDSNNPNLTEYEKDVVEYVNLVHSYFHGKFSIKFIAVVYHIIEVYDNSPGSKDAKGTRIMPKLP